MEFNPGGNAGRSAGTGAPKRLYRKREGEMLGGVAAGLADYFQLDVSLVRLIIIVLTVLTGGAGIVAYILAWIVIPEEPRETAGAGVGAGTYAGSQPFAGEASAGVSGGEGAEAAGMAGQGRTFVGTAEPQPDPDVADGGEDTEGTAYHRHILRRRQFLGWALVIVGIWALIDRFFPWFRWDLFWPLGLILVGVALVLRTNRDHE
jgi:phage shock protein C